MYCGSFPGSQKNGGGYPEAVRKAPGGAGAGGSHARRQAGGLFNQSLMELGAVVCIPNGMAKCQVCPVQHLCSARAHGTVLEYPKKAAKRQRRIEENDKSFSYRTDRNTLSAGVRTKGFWQVCMNFRIWMAG